MFIARTLKSKDIVCKYGNFNTVDWKIVVVVVV